MSFLNVLAIIFTAGVPVFLLSFALIGWALHTRRLQGDTVTDIRGSIKALGKSEKSGGGSVIADPVLKRWLRFGGGFYGVVALYTLFLVELEDALNFIKAIGDIVISFEFTALGSVVLKLLIDSLMNFVVAISWPAYWLQNQREAWMLLFPAYAGYWLGIRAAHYGWRGDWVNKTLSRIDAARGRSRK